MLINWGEVIKVGKDQLSGDVESHALGFGFILSAKETRWRVSYYTLAWLSFHFSFKVNPDLSVENRLNGGKHGSSQLVGNLKQ
jgi:hypothetical protein